LELFDDAVLAALGTGTLLFSPTAAPVQLRLLSAEAIGPTILARYGRFAG
jgi:hypothetical protein